MLTLPDEITVDVFMGPAGSCGFRTGWWKICHQGRRYRMYASVPHSSELGVQAAQLRAQAANLLSLPHPPATIWRPVA